MLFERAYIKAVRADLLRGTIVLQFEVAATPEALALRHKLAQLREDDQAVSLRVSAPGEWAETAPEPPDPPDPLQNQLFTP